jgi:lipoprotein-anchoring transpeptidase ErfK/SrfK
MRSRGRLRSPDIRRSWAAWRVAGAVIAAATLLAGCSGSGSDSKSTAPPAHIAVTPKDGATGVKPAQPVKVRVEGGRLTRVTLTDADGSKVPGNLSTDNATWSSRGVLDFTSRYTVTASAANADGAPTTSRTTFTTIKPKSELHTAVVPLSGETVGIGLPIQVHFSAPVENRAAVERNLVVESDPAVVGAWHWIDSETVRYRPKEYWTAGTKVTLHVRLQGVDAGNGVYGDEERDIPFTIGRAVRSVVDAKALRMKVYVDGALARTVPVTTGKKGFETRNGIKVVLEKYKLKIMDARTVGISPDDPDYYRLRVHWAIRVTWSGEFVHGAEWSTAAQGRERVSHGCVGMSLSNAKWLFGLTKRGDIIQVVHSPTSKTMELDNGFGDWNLSWSEWTAGSAL